MFFDNCIQCVVGNNYNNAENIRSGTLVEENRTDKFVIKLLRAQGECLGDDRR